jgi:arylsulfatase A-like enzyme
MTLFNFSQWRHRGLVALVLLFLLFGLLTTPGRATAIEEGARRSGFASQGPPNVLIIITDDQRADMMKFLPRTEKTFGRKGVEFTQAFAPTPLCCPARASIMTGQYAHNSGVRRQSDGPAINQDHTMQHYLNEAGYQTALVGKYLNNWPLVVPPPNFDRFAVGKHYRDVSFNVDGRIVRITKYVPDYLGNKAVNLLRRFDEDDDRPWFMMLTPSTPHIPATPAPRHKNVRLPRWMGNPATGEEDLSDKPPIFYNDGRPDEAEAKPQLKTYEKMARSLLAGDDLVLKVFNAMRELKEGSNTLAFFISDNGYALGEHALSRKRKPYPIASQVPLFMRWPDGLSRRGVADDRLVANIDILPSVLQAAGLSPASGHVLDGNSLQGTQRRSRILLEDFQGNGAHHWASVLSDEEQYTEYYEADGERIFQEYYDVLADPWRLTNTLGDDDPVNDPSPPTLQRLANQLAADRECAGSNCP